MTTYEYLRKKTDAAYRKWYAAKPGLISVIRWLVYKHWDKRLTTLPLYEAVKHVKEEK